MVSYSKVNDYPFAFPINSTGSIPTPLYSSPVLVWYGQHIKYYLFSKCVVTSLLPDGLSG